MKTKAAIKALQEADRWAVVVETKHEKSSEFSLLWSDDAEHSVPRLRKAVRMALPARAHQRRGTP
jgi:hypothetical protein